MYVVVDQLPWLGKRELVCCCVHVIMWFLFGEVTSSSGCLATVFYYGTPRSFHIIIFHDSQFNNLSAITDVMQAKGAIYYATFQGYIIFELAI